MASSVRLFTSILSKSCSRYLPRYGFIYASKLQSKLCKGRFISTGQTLKSINNVDERIHVLEKVGFSKDEAQKYLNKTNQLKIMLLETLEEKIHYFKGDLKLDDSQVKIMMMKQNRVLKFSIARLSQTVGVLVHDLKCDSLELTNLITSFPDIFYISPELLHSNIGALPGKFEISFELFREYVLRKPAILTFSEEHVNSLIEYLKEMKLNLNQIRNILLVKGVVNINTTRLKECFGVLKDNFMLKDSELKTLIISKPHPLGYLRAERVAESCKYLLSEFGDSKDLIKEMVMKGPEILCFKTSTLKPKVDYAMNELGLSIEDLVKEFSGLSHKLERIKERHKFLILHFNKEKKFPKLLSMLIPGDKLFLERFTKDATLEQFTEFKNNRSHKQ